MKCKVELVITEIGDERMAVPVGDGAENLHCVLRVNETAQEILNCLQEDTTEEAIVEHLFSLYDAPKEQLLADVRKLVNQLKEYGLLA